MNVAGQLSAKSINSFKVLVEGVRFFQMIVNLNGCLHCSALELQIQSTGGPDVA